MGTGTQRVVEGYLKRKSHFYFRCHPDILIFKYHFHLLMDYINRCPWVIPSNISLKLKTFQHRGGTGLFIELYRDLFSNPKAYFRHVKTHQIVPFLHPFFGRSSKLLRCLLGKRGVCPKNVRRNTENTPKKHRNKALINEGLKRAIIEGIFRGNNWNFERNILIYGWLLKHTEVLPEFSFSGRYHKIF